MPNKRVLIVEDAVDRQSLLCPHRLKRIGAFTTRTKRYEIALERRILIVEDDPALRDAYRLVLEHAGYETVTAENGKEALTKLKNGEPLPHLILLDLMMPVMNGWEFLEARRADPVLGGVPVVALTCGAAPAPVGDAIAVADKPMDIFDLTTLVRKHL